MRSISVSHYAAGAHRKGPTFDFPIHACRQTDALSDASIKVLRITSRAVRGSEGIRRGRIALHSSFGAMTKTVN